MDDEEAAYQSFQEPLYRVESGNYKYRLILRCRQQARAAFARWRADVLIKLELLETKHLQDIVCQMRRLMQQLATFHQDVSNTQTGQKLFPIELDLSKSSLSVQREQPTAVDLLYSEYRDKPDHDEEEADEEEEVGEEHLAFQNELFAEFDNHHAMTTANKKAKAPDDLLCLDD